MTNDVAGVRSTLYAIMRDYLNDARGNLVIAQHHAGAGKWMAAASSCSISSRLLLDLRSELAEDQILLSRQRNQLTRDANNVRTQLWQVAQKIRRCGKAGREVSKMLRSFVAYDEARVKQQAAEA